MLGVDEVLELFERARSEMYVAPSLVEVRVAGDRPSVLVREGAFRVTVPGRLLEDPEGGPLLLWYFRHDLAHLHYCPYNLRTVQTLARAAYEETRSWIYSHNAVRLFADLQVDLFYLPLKFRQPPLHLVDEFSRRPRGVEALRYSAYKHVYKDLLPSHRINRDVRFYGSLVAEITLSPRSWVTKVRAIAAILKRLRDIERIKGLPTSAGEGVPLSEDLERDFLAEARRVMGGLGKEEARELYRHWIRGRVDTKRIEEELKKVVEGVKSRPPRGAGRGVEEVEVSRAPERGSGEEPELPSSLSKPLSKAGDLDSLVWRALWYRARAEEFLISYGGRRRGGTWAIYAYTDTWSVEDDIEDLDLEASLEEGPLIPEETTLRDVNLPSPSGEVLVQERAPSVLVVLDTSRSMQGAIDEAAIAAFAAYLSARRQGGRAAVVNFSTRYLVAGWDAPDLVKDLILAVSQGELTILPLAEIKALLDELEPGERAVVTLVTDCGWQNLRDALGFLEKLAALGHKVVVFHIEGWRYPKSVEAVSKVRGLTLYRVSEPAALKSLVLGETEARTL